MSRDRDPALGALHRRARLRRLSMTLVGATGLTALLAGLVPALMGELLELTGSPTPGSLLAGRVVLVQAGLLLLLTARLLGRGSRGAWTVATGSSVGVLVAEVLRERLGPAAVLAGLSLVLLLSTRSAYRLRFTAGRRGRRLLVPAAAFAGLVAFALVAYTELDAMTGTTGGRVSQILRTLVFAPGGIDVEQTAVEAYVIALRAGAVLVLIALVWALRRDRRDLLAGREAARQLAERYGRSSTAPLLALPDNARLPLVGGQALAGLAVRNGVAISLGLPVAPHGHEQAALVELVQHCEQATRTPRRDAQLAAISAAWLADKGGPELGFTLGRFDLDRLDDQEVFVALVGLDTDDEQVVGFVTWLPYDGGNAAVLDLMRRGDRVPPGVMETLVVDSIADFAARGRAVASLGGVPLAATTERTDRTAQLLGWLYEHGDAVYAAKGLFRFKDKFDPRWEPMYLAYPRAADVPRIGLAALRAFLPSGALRELLAARRPGGGVTGAALAPASPPAPTSS